MISDKFILNKNFIDNYFRLLPTVIKLTGLFNDTIDEIIVKNELTHNSLIGNNKISECIIDFYFKCNENLITDNEFERFKKTGYIGEKNRILKPYSIDILGAYHRNCDLVFKLQEIVCLNIDVKINDKDVKNFIDLEPYFIEYKNGFKNGYDNFENNEINKYLIPFADKQDYLNKVFEYITKHIIFTHYWINPYGFTLQGFNNNIVNGFENGTKQGYFYKAWSIVFSNNHLFKPLFENYFNSLSIEPETNNPKKLKKTLLEFIHNIEDKEAFLLDLKNTFPTEIGKSLKGVIDILTKEKILIYGTKEFKQLFDEIKKYFNRDIGSYNSIQNVKFVDEETTEPILKKLNPLIIKYKTT